MNTRAFLRLATTISALLGLTACSESRTLDMDAGAVDSGAAPIDARDSAPPSVDAAPAVADAPRPDAPAAARDGSILPPSDAGDPFGDAGALGPPPWVPIDVLTMGTCDPLVPCGGDVVGTWDVQGGCIEVPIAMDVMRCPGAMIVSATGRARGRVTFDGTNVDRLAQSQAEIEVFIPAFCARFVGGCAEVESMLRMRVADSVCLEEGAGDCRCAARVTNTIDDNEAYTIAGNEIVGATSGKRWAYCVDAASGMRYEDVSPSNPEPGIIELTPRD